MRPIPPIYDHNDDPLKRRLKSIPAFRALLRAVEARFYDEIEWTDPILDVGCGDGHFVQMTFDHSITAGIDPWWRPINKAYRTKQYDHLVFGVANKMPFPDDYFGSAFSNSVLEHIPDVQAVLNETGRVMKQDGRFLITVPSQRFTQNLGGAAIFEKLKLNSAADRYRVAFNKIARHIHTDPPEVWIKRLNKAGFEVERWQYYFSTEALRALEIGHVQGLPSAILHGLTGKWIAAPWDSNLKWTEKWVRPFYEEDPDDDGTYLLFIARKT